MGLMPFSEDYLKTLKERAEKSKVYKRYQMTGLALAELLEDEAHKALYIRLSKQFEESRLLSLAKRVAGLKNVKNKGAYFMSMLYKEQS